MNISLNYRHILLNIVGEENREVMEFIWAYRVEIYTILDHALNTVPAPATDIPPMGEKHGDSAYYY